jgi:glycosyltransferase involved in cell wall biosynthesis/2-polyprenyl-3-methyl-5-hydroxy-6-metoxy-1,4-benzoquinol methylase
VRLTFVNASHPAMPCGVGDYAAQLAAAAEAAGHEVTMFTSADRRVRPADAGPPLLPVFRDWTVAEFARHARRIRATRPDAVVLQYPSLLPGPHSRLLFLLPGLLRPLLPRTRIVLVVHEYAHTHEAARRQLALAFAFAQDVVAVNPADLAAIRARHPRLASSARLASIGSNIPHVEAGRELLAELHGGAGSQLFFFGLLHGPDKGFDDLLEALAALGPDVRLAVGSAFDDAQPYHRELAQRIAALGLERRVSWLGYLEPERLSAALQAADLVVLPFKAGAAANRGTVAAALLNGAALVTTAGPETPEHLRDGESAALVPAGDPGALASELARLLADDGARERLRAGARGVAARYEWPAVVTETLGEARHTADGEWPAAGLEPVPACPVCGASARSVLHRDLRDRVSFVAPGTWTLYRCEACGAGYPDPRPSADTIGLAYAGYHTHAAPAPPHAPPPGGLGRLRWALAQGYLNDRYGYDFTPATRLGAPLARLLPRRRWLADMRVRHLPRPPGRPRLLDVGCGNGGFLRDMRDAGWEVAGIDPDPAAVATARATGADVREGLLGPDTFAPGSFDAVTLSHVIEHLPDPAETLAICHGLLKPGGVLWIATPNLESVGHRRFGPAWRGLEPPRHLAIFTRRALVGLLERLGYEVVATPRNYMARFFYRASHAIAERRDPGDGMAAGPGHVERGARLADAITLLGARHAEELMVVARRPRDATRDGSAAA